MQTFLVPPERYISAPVEALLEDLKSAEKICL